MIEDQIRNLGLNAVGRVIPKPEAKALSHIKGLGIRRGQEALIYTIPSHSKKSKHYVKGITLSEFNKAYSELLKSGSITKKWFNSKLPECAKEGSCNFTSIGGVFEILDLAKYAERGKYVATIKA